MNKIQQIRGALDFYADGKNILSSETDKMPDESFEYSFDNYGHGGAYVEDGRRAKQALTALSDLEKEQAWQGIEKNEFCSGKRFLVCDSRGIPFIAWRSTEDNWCTFGLARLELTLWRELPAPPEGE